MSRGRNGAVLMDALIGLVVLTVGLFAVANGMRTVIRAASLIEERSVADRLAAAKMTELLLAPGLFQESEGSFPKPHSRYVYRVSVGPTRGGGVRVLVSVGVKKKDEFAAQAMRSWVMGREF